MTIRSAEEVAAQVARGVLADLSVTGWEVVSIVRGVGRPDRGAEDEPNLLVAIRPEAAPRPTLLAFFPLDVALSRASVVLAHHVFDGALRLGLSSGLVCPGGQHVMRVRESSSGLVWGCECTPDGARPLTGS